MAASNVALSRGAPILPNARAIRATICGVASARFKTSLSLPSSSLFYTRPKPLVALRGSVNRCSPPAGPTPIRATIATGDRLPDATLSYVDEDGRLGQNTSVAELTEGKKVVLLAVRNALRVDNMFYASQFVEMAKKLRALGVDTVACVAQLPVGHSSKVRAWRTFVGNGTKESGVVLLADSGELVKALVKSHWPLRVCVKDGVVTTAGEFYGKSPDKDDAVQVVKHYKKLKDLLGLMISGKTAATRPQPVYKKKITSEGINENGFIDSASGKTHIEELMKQQVKQEYMNKLYELKGKFEKQVATRDTLHFDRSKILSVWKELVGELEKNSGWDRSKIESLKKLMGSSKIESLRKDAS